MNESDSAGEAPGTKPQHSSPQDSVSGPRAEPVGASGHAGQHRPGGPEDQGREGQGRAGQGGPAQRQGYDRQRLEPQDQPPADVLDDENIAGEKDFELRPPADR
jgi:hypothetical protein